MNYKNNTPFKLKGSPFKQTLEPNHNEGQGNNPNMVKDVFAKENKNKLIGDGGGNDVIDLTASGASGPAVDPTSTSGSGTMTDEDGNVSNVISTQTVTQGAGDVIKASEGKVTGQMPGKKMTDEQWTNYLANESSGRKAQRLQQQADAGKREGLVTQDMADEQNKNNSKKKVVTNTKKAPLSEYEYGTKQSSYESRKNVRTTKSNANTIKNNTIGKGRQTWKGMSENEKLLATGGTKEMKEVDGKQVATGNIIGGSGKRGEYMKSIKSKAKVEKKDAIIAKSKSELLNSQNASDQNIGLGGKVEGRTVDVTTADTQAVIEAAQNASNQSNNLIKKGVKAGTIDKLTDSKLKFKGGAKYGKRSTPFKQQGYTFGASKK
jgi:hypothetical protein